MSPTAQNLKNFSNIYVKKVANYFHFFQIDSSFLWLSCGHKLCLSYIEFYFLNLHLSHALLYFNIATVVRFYPIPNLWFNGRLLKTNSIIMSTCLILKWIHPDQLRSHGETFKHILISLKCNLSKKLFSFIHFTGMRQLKPMNTMCGAHMLLQVSDAIIAVSTQINDLCKLSLCFHTLFSDSSPACAQPAALCVRDQRSLTV